MDYGLQPDPPQWALAAGLPEPESGETFSEYVLRLGLSPDSLLDGLTEQTVCLANGRLATALQRSMPQSFDLYVDALCEGVLDSERRAEVERIAQSLWNGRYRRPKQGVSLHP